MSARGSCPIANVGDFIVLEVAGAYGFVMGSNYNSKPLAPEILVSAGHARTWFVPGRRLKTSFTENRSRRLNAVGGTDSRW